MSRQRWIAAVLLALGLSGVSSQAFAAGALDGKTFSGSIGDKGKTTGQADNFVFQNGKFESTLCEKHGYGTGEYLATPKDGALNFTAETTSKEGGKMDWKGMVKGDAVEGAVLSTEKNKTSEMWFRGSLKKTKL